MTRKLFDRLQRLAEQVAEFVPAPSRSREERAVYDAWLAALKPRARRMVRRVERFADARAWEFDEDRRPVRIRATRWNELVREFAGLYTELAGALVQYEHMRIVWRPKMRFGIQRVSGTSVVTTKTKARVRAAEKKALESARKARMKAAKRVLDAVLSRLEARRKLLRASTEDVQHLLAALQAAEEARLDDRMQALKEGTPEREQAEDLLADLAQGRLNAERFRGPSSSGYGTILRRQWLQPRGRLVRLLEGP